MAASFLTLNRWKQQHAHPFLLSLLSQIKCVWRVFLNSWSSLAQVHNCVVLLLLIHSSLHLKCIELCTLKEHLKKWKQGKSRTLNSTHNCCSYYIIIIIQRAKFASKPNRWTGSMSSPLHSSATTWQSSLAAPHTPFGQPAALPQSLERKAWQAKQLAPSHQLCCKSCEHTTQGPKPPGRFCTHLGSCCLLLLPSPPPVSNTTGVSPQPLCTGIPSTLSRQAEITVFALQGKAFSAAEKQLESFQSHGLASFSCLWSHPKDLLQRFSVLFPSIIQPNKKVQHPFIPPSFHSSHLLRGKNKKYALNNL